MSDERDLNLISYVWFNFWNDKTMKRPTAKDFKKMLSEFKRGERVRRLEHHRWIDEDIKIEVPNERVIKKFM